MATVPTFRTWVAGEIATAAFFNSNVRDAGNFFISVPIAELRQSVSQSLASGSAQLITYDTEDIDNDNGHSNTTNPGRYTAVTRGRFQVSGGVSFSPHADSAVRQIEIDLNGTGSGVAGSDVAVVGFSADNCRIMTRVKQIFLNGTTDFVSISAFQASTVSLSTVITSAQQPNMSVRWVSTT